VAVIRVSKTWAMQPAVVAAPMIRSIENDGLDAFGSEVATVEPPIVTTIQSEKPGPVATLVAASPSRFSRAATPGELATPDEPTTPVPSSSAPGAPRGRSTASMVATWILIALVSAAAAATVVWQYQRQRAATAAGSLTIQTNPAGAEVFIAGQLAGKTPLTTSLAPGAYDLRVAAGEQARDFKVTVAAGASIVRDIELPTVVTAAVAAPAKGSLRIQTDVKQAIVSVDGVERGASPLTIDDLDPGDHQVVVRGDRGTVRRTVTIKPTETLSLMISGAEPPAPLPGWLSIASPVALQLREEGRLIGTTETDRLMLPSGEHTFEIVNEALGYRTTRTFTIASGKTTASSIELPMGLLSVNAAPWAEVFVDGERIGETPIANLSRRIGEHRVTFRHPDLGERTETVVVTLRQPTRLGIDMRRTTQ
jgi:hypothetical protein